MYHTATCVGTLAQVSNQKLAIQIYQTIPGTKSYLENCYRELISLSYYKTPTAFFTFSLNPQDAELQSYLQQMRCYRPPELRNSNNKMLDLFPQLQFTHHHFNNIICLIRKNIFWHGYSCIHYAYVIEYHKHSGNPHCHLIVWVDLPFTLRDVVSHGDTAEEWLLHFWDSMLSTQPKDAPTYSPFLQHTCLPQRCFKKGKNKCRSGFPHIPLPRLDDTTIFFRHFTLLLLRCVQKFHQHSFTRK